MATMWPRTLTVDVTSDRLRQAECEVYRELDTVLDDSFVVYYSRPWLGTKPDGEEIDGECDFVIAHADLGMLTIEVKGGAVAFDPQTNEWTSRDSQKVIHSIKNPVQQAKDSKHQLLRKLWNSPHWRRRWIRARHGVILPYSEAPAGDLGADMPQRIFCFATEYRLALRDWIMQRFGDRSEDGDTTRELGRDGLRALKKLLARPFQLRTPLGSILSGYDHELQTLTRQQFHIRREIADKRRAAIRGGAGTGKTVLAMEEARRCAKAGDRTLFVCFNLGLAAEIRERMKDVPSLSVTAFHELCEKLCETAGLEVPDSLTDAKRFEEVHPELLLKTFERRPDLAYDAIIADEGQDFHTIWWVALQAGLKMDGLFRIFFDNNQRVFDRANEIPRDVDLVPIQLTQNLRNTQRIHETVSRHYSGPTIEAHGPKGEEVDWITVGSREEISTIVAEHVNRLMSVERVAEGEIAVLVTTMNHIDGTASSLQIDNSRVARCDEVTHGRIIVDSIRRFKGLERPVVVIAATDGILKSKELPYVALSRARTHLIVVGTEQVLSRLQEGR